MRRDTYPLKSRTQAIRDALDKIEKREWTETEEGPPFEGKVKVNRTLSGENAFEALKQADEIKGPSYADTEYFGDLKHFYKENGMIKGRYAKWAISKLKQYMGIE